jgi:hypothetical protein
MAKLTPLTDLPQRSATLSDAVTVLTAKVRLQAVIDGQGEATFKLIRQYEGGDWVYVAGGCLQVSSYGNKSPEIVVGNVQPGTLYHVVGVGNAAIVNTVRVYLCEVADPLVHVQNDTPAPPPPPPPPPPPAPTPPVVVTFSATPAFASVASQQLTLTDNVTSWTIADGTGDQEVVVFFVQDGTGGRMLSGTPANVRLAGGSLTLSNGANKIDVLGLKWNASLPTPAWVERYRSLSA